jgi:hypothetical protein
MRPGHLAIALPSFLGLLAAAGLSAAGPDPPGPQSTIPSWIYVVGTINPGGSPDVAGAKGPDGQANVIIIRDFAGNPVAGVGVHLQFPCDVFLCPASIAGQSVDCSTRTLSGVTDDLGRWEFVTVGASADPGHVAPYGDYCGDACSYPGGGFHSTIVTADGYVGALAFVTAVCLDLDGALPLGSPGPTGLDVAKEINTCMQAIVSPSDPAAYRGRADQNASGTLSMIDVSCLMAHLGRIASQGGMSAGCPVAYCANAPCP